MELDKTFHEREPEAQPAAAVIQAAVRLDERVEDALQHARLDSNPAVPHREARDLMLRKTPRADADRSPRLGELVRVLENVSDDLSQTRRIAADPERLRREIEEDRMSASFDLAAMVLHRGADEGD